MITSSAEDREQMLTHLARREREMADERAGLVGERDAVLARLAQCAELVEERDRTRRAYEAMARRCEQLSAENFEYSRVFAQTSSVSSSTFLCECCGNFAKSETGADAQEYDALNRLAADFKPGHERNLPGSTEEFMAIISRILHQTVVIIPEALHNLSEISSAGSAIAGLSELADEIERSLMTIAVLSSGQPSEGANSSSLGTSTAPPPPLSQDAQS